MTEIKRSKCPYCGSGILEEEDGYRCKFCKSFFPFREEEAAEEAAAAAQAPASRRTDEVDIDRFSMIQPRAPQSDEEKEFQRLRIRNELIGMAAAFVSAVFMVLCKLLSLPFLMIPGFVFWAFTAGFTGFQVYKALKAGHRMLYIRVFLFLVVAILMLILIEPKH